MPEAIDRFRDSTDALERPEVLRARLQEESYLFFRGLLDRDAIWDIRAEILQVLQPLGWLAPGTDPDDAVPGEDVRREGDEQWWEGYRAIQSVYAFHALPHRPALIATTEILLGGETFVHPRSICRVTYPPSEHPTPPHQDFPLIQGTADVLTCWIPLSDISVEMGALRILRGSHREGLRRAVQAEGVGGVGVEVDTRDRGWATVDYRMGDALFFHAFTVHWAPPNRATRIRLSADARYQRIDDPVVEESLLPHGYPAIPGWDELSSGWPDKDPIAVPEGLRTVDLQSPLEARPPRSRFVDRVT